MAFLREQGKAGATAEAIAAELGLRIQSATARIHELTITGTIRDSGRRRPTSSGRGAIVWVPVHDGGDE